MKGILTLCLLVTGTLGAAGQDVGMRLNTTTKGYSYESYTFPKDIQVFKMDKSRHTLTPKGLTMVQVWSLKDGAQSRFWDQVDQIRKNWTEKGLTVLSVNFENGSDFYRQREDLAHFFKVREKPDNFYFDAMGYVADFLKVPGFPTYFLVDEKGEVIFYTLGEDEDGVALLETEIQLRLEKKVADGQP